jgi:hypothetical protein
MASRRCLFISFRSTNRAQALWLARRAARKKIPVFLDVWDPMLTAVSASKLHKKIQTLLTAIIIEIALLRCTHLMVVHTTHTKTSVWVPYELGRAKHRVVSSNAAAFWHGAARLPGYAHLVECIERKAPHTKLDKWLSTI